MTRTALGTTAPRATSAHSLPRRLPLGAPPAPPPRLAQAPHAPPPDVANHPNLWFWLVAALPAARSERVTMPESISQIGRMEIELSTSVGCKWVS
ncbi:hypothetical protein E2562_013386 [Oryza meyeriana var. granulata]|uniref:Uncharacterized protein n=1 Tax=Oryza meyeriana var. granulata TaxID=110450 RepID=A0A6G1CFA6_9ORYZ|nr:hypothetical protein E2562_013386 [Oryza meyeriana var. granulata]